MEKIFFWLLKNYKFYWRDNCYGRGKLRLLKYYIIKVPKARVMYDNGIELLFKLHGRLLEASYKSKFMIKSLVKFADVNNRKMIPLSLKSKLIHHFFHRNCGSCVWFLKYSNFEVTLFSPLQKKKRNRLNFLSQYG